MDKSKTNIKNNKRKTIKKKVKKRTLKKWGGVDKWLLLAIGSLLSLGLVMIYSASSYYAMYENGSSEFFLKKIFVWVVIGVAVMIVTMNIDYKAYKSIKFIGIMYLITIVLLIWASVSGAINGANRWIRIGGLSFQPSELAKYVAVLSIAFSIDFSKKNIRKFSWGIVLNFAIAGILAVLILAGKNLSITAIVMMVAFIMIFVGGAKKVHILPFIPIGAIAGYILMRSADYRWARVTSFLDPWKHLDDGSFQLVQSLYALSSGGFFGVGLGQSRQKMLFIPEPHNDFIFSIIGEEFGLLGCILVIGIFLFIITRGISVATKAKDTFGFLVAVGIVSVIALQAIVNIAVASGAMPVTGVPMPFVSYGGTALVVNMAAIGILLNISRTRIDIAEGGILEKRKNNKIVQNV